MKKFLIIKNQELNEYIKQNENKDIKLLKTEHILDMRYFNVNDDYDIYVVGYNSNEDKKTIIYNLTCYFLNTNKEFIIYDKKEDVVYDNESLFVLRVGEGEYEDYYTSVKGLFKTRKSAKEYYKKHFKVSKEDIENNNKKHNEYSENEPKEEDYENYEDYYKKYNEYWDDCSFEYMDEGNITTFIIDKAKIIDI